ncbi:MAG: AmmeMemoRadiSam system protein B [Candidatus Aminicenantales bacterium]
MKRKAAVAGYFYPRRPEDLLQTLEQMVLPKVKKEKALSVLSPHAGYEYSGPVAGAVFSSVVLPSTFVILGPSHRPIRPRFALMSEGSWETPLGNVPIESGLARLIGNYSRLTIEDSQAHSEEHSIEVQLPFIQFFKKEFSIVPAVFSYLATYEELEELGKALARGIQEFQKEVLIVASTDMSHYVSQEEAKEKDFLAIQKVLNLDAEGLFSIVQEEDISMCGYQPVISAIIASKELGAEKGELIKYATSGDRTGDFAQVVGYAGIRIH